MPKNKKVESVVSRLLGSMLEVEENGVPGKFRLFLVGDKPIEAADGTTVWLNGSRTYLGSITLKGDRLTVSLPEAARIDVLDESGHVLTDDRGRAKTQFRSWVRVLSPRDNK